MMIQSTCVMLKEKNNIDKYKMKSCIYMKFYSCIFLWSKNNSLINLDTQKIVFIRTSFQYALEKLLKTFVLQ